MNEIKDYSDDKTIMGYMYKALKESLEKKKPAREASFELLRIVSMLMVITLHYLSKGGILDLASPSMGDGKWGFWILEAFAIVAVNAYVLLSGYFMVNGEYSIPKLVGVWCQVFFYSITIAVVMTCLGYYSVNDLLCLKNILFFIFPGVNGHYWFATGYMLMYMFSPFIAKAIKAMEKEKLLLAIVIVLIPCCFVPSLSPFTLAVDDKGNSFVWFLCLFMIAGYIRLHGIKIFESKISSGIVYVLSALGIVLTRMGLCIFTGQHEGYDTLPLITTQYNFVFVLTASMGFFCLFKNMKLKENFFTAFIVRISPFVFGVYLLHEHLTLRYLWPVWFKVGDEYGPLRIVHYLLTIIIIFSLGVIIDVIRTGIFFICKKIMIWGLNIYFAKREVWDYLIFGFLATVVNWVAYIVCAYCLLIPFIQDNENLLKTVANVIAWVAAVIFAYWTNRNFVFKSKVTGLSGVMKEFAAFVGARVFSFVVEQGLFMAALAVNMSDIIAKLAISVIVIILNYIFSKLFIFKGKKQES